MHFKNELQHSNGQYDFFIYNKVLQDRRYNTYQ